MSSIPGSERSPGVGNGNPLQYFCLENSMDWEAWWATVHGVKQLNTTEQLNNRIEILQMLLTQISKALKEDSQALVHSLLPKAQEPDLRSAESKSESPCVGSWHSLLLKFTGDSKAQPGCGTPFLNDRQMPISLTSSLRSVINKDQNVRILGVFQLYAHSNLCNSPLIKSLSLFYFFLLFGHACGMWDLSSPTGNRIQAPCIGSTESQPLDHQGSPSPKDDWGGPWDLLCSFRGVTWVPWGHRQEL